MVCDSVQDFKQNYVVHNAFVRRDCAIFANKIRSSKKPFYCKIYLKDINKKK